MCIQTALSTRLKCLLILAFSLGIVGCGKDNGKAGSDAGMSFTTTLVERAWTLPAGQETFKCKGIVAARDIYIKGFRAPTPPGLARMTVTVSDTVGTLGDYDCSAGDGVLGFRMIYAAGPGVNDVVFPAGKGVIVRAGQYIHLSVHVANKDGTAALSGTTQLLMSTGSAAEVGTPVEMIYIGTYTISIPPNSTGAMAIGGCSYSSTQAFLFVAPAMRKHGMHQLVYVVSENQTVPQTILDKDFDVTQQHIYPVTPEFVIHPGDSIRTACTHNGASGYTIRYGDSVDLEMCFTGVYRYPVASDPNIFECVSS